MSDQSTHSREPRTQDQDDGLQILHKGRRRLLRGGLAVAPVLMTLASRSAFGWGGNFQCFTPSGFVSMPTSQHGTPTYCSGRTPGYWKQSQHFSSWLPPYYPTSVSGPSGHQATLFKSYFQPLPGTCPFASGWDTTTFLQVLSAELYTTYAGSPFDVARLLIASLLNIAQGWVPVLTPTLVQGIWTEYMTKGYFEPTAGVKWYHDQIVSYLQSTQTL